MLPPLSALIGGQGAESRARSLSRELRREWRLHTPHARRELAERGTEAVLGARASKGPPAPVRGAASTLCLR